MKIVLLSITAVFLASITSTAALKCYEHGKSFSINLDALQKKTKDRSMDCIFAFPVPAAYQISGKGHQQNSNFHCCSGWAIKNMIGSGYTCATPGTICNSWGKVVKKGNDQNIVDTNENEKNANIISNPLERGKDQIASCVNYNWKQFTSMISLKAAPPKNFNDQVLSIKAALDLQEEKKMLPTDEYNRCKNRLILVVKKMWGGKAALQGAGLIENDQKGSPTVDNKQKSPSLKIWS